MSKEREALKLALECVMAWDRGCDRDPYWRDIEAAVTAIKEALAEQPAQHDLKPKFVRNVDGVPCITLVEHEHLMRSRSKPAQQQEPVAWRDPKNADPGQGCTYDKAAHEKWPHIYTQPLYTTPQPRQWQGLTDEEIIEVIHPLVMADMADEATDYEIARAIESKLKEKNT